MDEQVTVSSPVDEQESAYQKMTLENSVIKGYHAFKIKPPYTSPPTALIVEPEYTNIHDQNACLVWLPPIDKFPEELRGMTTDDKRCLTLTDIAGLPVGHVPRCIAGFFRGVMDIGTVTAVATGQPVPSFSPWPSPSEEGGGVVIPCNYIVTHPNISVLHSKLTELLATIPEGSAMEIVLSK